MKKLTLAALLALASSAPLLATQTAEQLKVDVTVDLGADERCEECHGTCEEAEEAECDKSECDAVCEQVCADQEDAG